MSSVTANMKVGGNGFHQSSPALRTGSFSISKREIMIYLLMFVSSIAKYASISPKVMFIKSLYVHIK